MKRVAAGQCQDWGQFGLATLAKTHELLLGRDGEEVQGKIPQAFRPDRSDPKRCGKRDPEKSWTSQTRTQDLFIIIHKKKRSRSEKPPLERRIIDIIGAAERRDEVMS